MGGIDLAAEWAGFETVLQVEKDPYCRKVLRKHWPNVKRIERVEDVTAESVDRPITLVSGGPPCQPHSLQGKRRGKRDSRFLWPEMLRVVVAIQPKWILVENVFGALSDNLADSIIDDLEAANYKIAPPLVFSAYAYGADFCGERAFFVAAADCLMGEERLWNIEVIKDEVQSRYLSESMGKRMDADASVDRAAHGIPYRVDRLRALGNAVVPQQVYPILRAIADIELGGEL